MTWIVLVVLIALAASILFPGFVGGVWSPTSMKRVRAMLKAADLRPGETIYDLGAGDGRVIFTAAREFGARSVGVEIDPLRYALCRVRIVLGRLSDRVSMRWGNFFDMNLQDADVVTFFLSQAAADRLAEKLRVELHPGARVVSHQRPLTGWKPYHIDRDEDLYVYRLADQEWKRPTSGDGKGNTGTPDSPTPSDNTPRNGTPDEVTPRAAQA